MGFFRRTEKEQPVKELKAMVSGRVLPLTEVADPVFSSKSLGDGIAIRPCEEVVTAPADGEISVVAETKHAVGMVLKNGAELLLHIGLDTVSLEGKGFQMLVKQGKKVKQGDPLLRFDKAWIEAQGHATDCILVVTNTEEFPDLQMISGMEAVQKGTVICTF